MAICCCSVVCIEGAHASLSLIDLIMILAVKQGPFLLAHAWHWLLVTAQQFDLQACRQPTICGLPAAASEALVEKSLKEKMILGNVKELAKHSLVSA